MPSPAEVLAHFSVTEDYLCTPEDNVYQIDFTRFKIRDLHSNATLFEIAKPPGNMKSDEDEVDPNAGRFVRYQFTPEVFNIFCILLLQIQRLRFSSSSWKMSEPLWSSVLEVNLSRTFEWLKDISSEVNTWKLFSLILVSVFQTVLTPVSIFTNFLNLTKSSKTWWLLILSRQDLTVSILLMTSW